MKIVTFNLRYRWDGDGINSFVHRAGMIYEKIRRERPDVIAFQEATKENFDFISHALSDIYDMHMRCRSENFDGEGLAFAFLRGSAELLTLESFWLSPTPNTPGSRFEGQSPSPRIAVLATVRDLISCRMLRICNVHLDNRSEDARILGSRLMLSDIEKRNADVPLETVILGDMNARPDSAVISEMLNFSLELSDLTKDVKVSFHGFGKSAVKIDYIFATPQLAAISSKAVPWDELHSGIYLSDHYPIEVDFG